MKGSTAMPDWRTLQIFLEDDGVYELEADSEDYKKMRCNCSVYKLGRRCKHMRHVRRRIEENGGTYAIQIPSDVNDNEVIAAMKDRELFRTFVINNAKIEVIE